jgi:hypothetical protein
MITSILSSRGSKVGTSRGNHRFEILLLLIDFCREHLNRLISSLRFFKCFLLTPLFTRFRQSLKLFSFKFRRIRSITSFSVSSNWNRIASKGVRSSQAISIIRSRSASSNVCFIIICFSDILFNTRHPAIQR